MHRRVIAGADGFTAGAVHGLPLFLDHADVIGRNGEEGDHGVVQPREEDEMEEIAHFECSFRKGGYVYLLFTIYIE